MYSLKAISYEEARLQHFEYQLSRAKNRLKWAVDRRLEWESGERGAEVSYYQDVVDMLKKEAEPVRHGRWKENRYTSYDNVREEYVDWFTYTCSECGGEAMNNYDYCPNCGAKMMWGDSNG